MKKRHVASSLAFGGVAAAAGVTTMVVSRFNGRKHREEAQLEARRREKAEARRRERQHESPFEQCDEYYETVVFNDRSNHRLTHARRSSDSSSRSGTGSEHSRASIISSPPQSLYDCARADSPTSTSLQLVKIDDATPDQRRIDPYEYWTLDYATQKWYHDGPEEGVRHFPDGTNKRLAPRAPAPPAMTWDTRQGDYYWRDDVNKCWRYANGLTIPYSAE